MPRYYLCAMIIGIFLPVFSVLAPAQQTTLSDADLLQIFYQNHPTPFAVGIDPPTYEEFRDSVKYYREDVDIDGDGRLEVTLSGTYSHIEWVFFAIYRQDDSDQWTEIHFLKTFGKYDSDSRHMINQPYVYVDFLTSWGGTGIYAVGITRSVVRCNHGKCDSISFNYYSAGRAADAIPGESGSSGFNRSTYSVDDDRVDIHTFGYNIDSVRKTTRYCSPGGKVIIGESMSPEYRVNEQEWVSYQWDGSQFVESDRLFTPEYLVSKKMDWHSSGMRHILNLAGENSTPEQKMDTYNEFFHLDDNEREKSPVMPCEELYDIYNPSWFPSNIVSATLEKKGQSFYALINPDCHMVIETKSASDATLQKANSSLISLDDCNPDYLKLEWMEFSPTAPPKLVITSGFINQKIWIFDPVRKNQLVFSASGTIRDDRLKGIQIEKHDGKIQLSIGRAYHTNYCYSSLSCYSFEPDYDTYFWDERLQEFIPVT